MTSVTKLELRKLIKRVQLDILKCEQLEGLSKETISELERVNNEAIADSINAQNIKEETEEGKKTIESMAKVYLAHHDKFQAILDSRKKAEPVKPVVPVKTTEPKKAEPVKTTEPKKAEPVKPVEPKKAEPVKVKTTIPEEKQTEAAKKANKKGRSWWKYLLTALGAAGLTVAILFMLKGCGKDKGPENVLPPDDPTPGFEQQLDENELNERDLQGIEELNIDDVNINDYNELLGAAQKIQAVLPEGNKFSLEEIQYAIVLANWDKLENKNIFREAEEIYSAARAMGIILDDLKINADDLCKSKHPEISDAELNQSLVNVTDLALTLDDFKGAKTETGYDIYKVLEICGAEIDIENDEDRAFQYAKVFNDIASQTTRNFTMLEDSEDLSPMYVIIGMYNANMDRILELSANRHLSTIYGTGIRNDGTYGDICVEELAAALRIVYVNGGYSGSEYSEFLNKDGAFIDLLTDENNKGLGR